MAAVRVAILGGTGFMGPDVVASLVRHGHEVTVLHRGQTEAALPDGVAHVHYARNDLAAASSAIRRFRPDVAVDMRPMTEKDATIFVAAFAGVARRAVVISSSDVYRAYGRLNGTEPGPAEPVPIDEDAPLREQLFADRGARPHDKAPSLAEYDKILVERVVLASTELPATVLRLGMIHGPRSYRHYPYVKRMLDDRPAIILAEPLASWRASLGFSQNVAHAVALAVERGAGARVYNVAEPRPHSVLELCRTLADAAGWPGRVVVLPDASLPPDLRVGAIPQDFVLDTARIRHELGYEEPVAFVDGVAATVAWLQVHPPRPDDPMSSLTLDYAREDEVVRQLAQH